MAVLISEISMEFAFTLKHPVQQGGLTELEEMG